MASPLSMIGFMYWWDAPLLGAWIGVITFLIAAAIQVAWPLFGTVLEPDDDASPTRWRAKNAATGLVRTSVLLAAVHAGIWLAQRQRSEAIDDVVFVAWMIASVVGGAFLAFDLCRLLSSAAFGRLETRRSAALAAGAPLGWIKREAFVGVGLVGVVFYLSLRLGGLLGAL